jgi:L-ascorbate metabolism protein UlaG (beta-lactamase superfamily)
MMQLTKYEHACFTVEQDGQLLVIDPGNFTTDFIAPDHVVGIVITHEHADHFDSELVASIIDKNPEAVIVAHSSITQTIEAFETIAVDTGTTLNIGLFRLEFFGGEHAAIFTNMPPLANLGVMINDLLYYPGDSFAVPVNRSVDTLALPVAAPWLKINETLDFLAAIKPRAAFPTHDAILSSTGQGLVDRMIAAKAEQLGIEYRRETKLTI